jgi:glucose uptake protein GlcU
MGQNTYNSEVFNPPPSPLSLGNIASMVSVQVLEEAVGYSICQSSLLISGLWGIFYFKEVTGFNRVKWGAAAVMCLAGIVGLTAMHKGKPPSGGAGR